MTVNRVFSLISGDTCLSFPRTISVTTRYVTAVRMIERDVRPGAQMRYDGCTWRCCVAFRCACFPLFVE